MLIANLRISFALMFIYYGHKSSTAVTNLQS